MIQTKILLNNETQEFISKSYLYSKFLKEFQLAIDSMEDAESMIWFSTCLGRAEGILTTAKSLEIIDTIDSFGFRVKIDEARRRIYELN